MQRNLKQNERDIDFDFSPPFDQNNVVVSNTRSSGVWGTEQQDVMKFIPDEPVILAVILQEDAYEVAVNGKHYIRYDHRVDPACHMVVMAARLQDITIEYYWTPYNTAGESDSRT